MKTNPLVERLKHHVSGAIARGEKTAIVEQTAQTTAHTQEIPAIIDDARARCSHNDTQVIGYLAAEISRLRSHEAKLLTALIAAQQDLADLGELSVETIALFAPAIARAHKAALALSSK